MAGNLKFDLPRSLDENALIRRLADHYALQAAEVASAKLALYDTFDWRLFNKSLMLQSCGSTLALRRLNKGDVLHRLEFSRPPVFIRDFPEGDLKDRLAPIVKMRALLKLVDVYSRSRTFRILNADEKTVVRLVVEEIRLPRSRSHPTACRHLWLKPVKGYPGHARNLADSIKEAGLTIGTEKESFVNMLAAAGHHPGGYSSKVDVQLDPAMRSDQAAKVILRFLFGVMRANAAVFEKDLDTEILHDLRVAVRRTRSALTQIKNVFPARATERFKKEFAYAGKLSNALRDLDVYLLKQDGYKAMLPDALRNEIDPLFTHLRKKRTQAFQRVMRGLKSERYGRIMRDWEAFLAKPLPDSATSPNAKLPVIELACRRIDKKFGKILKTGGKILSNSADEKLHALRIECKKLRYLMEFFASLFPRKKMDALIGQLKTLQDNLGDYNDLCVQQKYLLKIAAELPGDRQHQKKTLMAIGSLVESLSREKQNVKDAFADTFGDFAAPENQASFRRLFVLKAG